ncbi:MAG: hypothetical protein JW951_07815, partial [Lentisphaerae bacterium]|nr:hypothetical protein [Lentisphaerota bacterium]
MILAIDLGSTSFKAAVFNAGRRAGEGTCALVYNRGPGGRVELDGGRVIEALRTAAAGALQAAGGPVPDAVAVTSQAQTFTVTDAGGTPLMPFISWLDVRGGAARDALAANAAFAEVARHASFPMLLAGQQLCQVRRLRDTCPGLLAGDHRVIPLSGYAVMQLTGSPVYDRNLAAMSGFYSMESGSWWAAALDACGLRAEQLPPLADVGRAAGRTTDAAAGLGVPAGVP